MDTESLQESVAKAQPQWAPEPWTYDQERAELSDAHGCYIGDPQYCDQVPDEGMAMDANIDANGERIVACVNALAGIPTAALQQGVVRLMIEAVGRLQIENPGDFVYEVHERELLGWEGPRVQNWSAGCNCLGSVLRLLPAALLMEIVPPPVAPKVENGDG